MKGESSVAYASTGGEAHAAADVAGALGSYLLACYARQTDLAAWDRFEAENSDIFSNMLQFWRRRILG